jgi:hypothetical protein
MSALGPAVSGEALAIFERAEGIWSRLDGPEDRMTLMSRFHRAATMSVRGGDREAALELHMSVLEARKRTLGLFHQDTTLSRDAVRELSGQVSGEASGKAQEESSGEDSSESPRESSGKGSPESFDESPGDDSGEALKE